ncbi:MAG: rod shape-determining protein [Clostridiales bacterium]|nr:rod shape-determining protein [Clostridiales bacterium]
MASVEDIGIDLGSSNVLIYARRKGIVLNEPAMLAVDHESRNVIAIGREAHKMLGREPNNIEVIRPLQKGTIQDFDMLSIMLNHFVMRVIGKHIFARPRAVMSLSASSNEIEKRQLIIGMFEAGARRTQMIDRPLAAAAGADMDITQYSGQMVADVGGATTDIAVIASGEMSARNTLGIAGDAFTDAIIRYVRLKHNLLIGFHTAEDVKCAIGTVYPLGESAVALPIAGRNLVSGLPKQIEVTREEITEAMEEPLHQMLEGLHAVIERVPPELANDVFENGILLTGGGAAMKGLPEIIAEMMKIPCRAAENPQQCVAVGCGKALERPADFDRFLGDRRKGRR